MAYASGTPRSWTTGELVTASFMNGIRDALNELSAAILTTAGDMLYASSSTVRARLAKGTAGQVLKMNSGATAPEWGTVAVPMVRAYNPTTGWAASTWTTLTLGSESYDTDTMHDTGSNTERITFTTAGKYLIVVNVSGVSGTAGETDIKVRIQLNASGVIHEDYRRSTAESAVRFQTVLERAFAAGDYIYAQAFTTGATPALNTLVDNTWMTAHWLGP